MSTPNPTPPITLYQGPHLICHLPSPLSTFPSYLTPTITPNSTSSYYLPPPIPLIERPYQICCFLSHSINVPTLSNTSHHTLSTSSPNLPHSITIYQRSTQTATSHHPLSPILCYLSPPIRRYQRPHPSCRPPSPTINLPTQSAATHQPKEHRHPSPPINIPTQSAATHHPPTQEGSFLTRSVSGSREQNNSPEIRLGK